MMQYKTVLRHQFTLFIVLVVADVVIIKHAKFAFQHYLALATFFREFQRSIAS